MISLARALAQSFATRVARSLKGVQVRGVARLFYVTAPYVFGRGRRAVESVSGAILVVDPTEYADCMMLFGRYATELLAIIGAAVRPGDSVIDVGAQLGYVTYALARAVGANGAVHSFEPDPNALARLKGLIDANQLGRVTVFPFAASSAEGELSFGLSPTLGWSTAVAGSHLTNLSSILVKSVRVDDLWAAGKIRRPVRFVKLDVEGHECEALAGMEKLIEEDRPLIVCEVGPDLLGAAGRSVPELLGGMSRHRYRLFRISKGQGVLGQERAQLSSIRPTDSLQFCDVLAVPEEAALPLGRNVTLVPSP